MAQSQRAYNRERARRIAHGTWRPWDNPAQARGHVTTLLDTSTYHAIATAANLGQMTVWEIAHRARPVIKTKTAKALLAVTPAHIQPPRAYANGSMWRLRSLIAMGHTTGRIATALGASSSIIEPLIRGERATVQAPLRSDITRLFDAWWDKRPPRRTPAEKTAACKALQRAAVNNWPCPAALDDDELGLPGYKPTARWRYAHGTGIAGDDPLGKKRQQQPGRGGGQARRTEREAGSAIQGSRTMTHPKDSDGRYVIPSQEGETRVEADCSCGDGWNVPERVWDWISDRHAWAHNKGRDGLSALGRMEIRRIQPGKPGQPEPEAAGQPGGEAPADGPGRGTPRT